MFCKLILVCLKHYFYPQCRGSIPRIISSISSDKNSSRESHSAICQSCISFFDNSVAVICILYVSIRDLISAMANNTNCFQSLVIFPVPVLTFARVITYSAGKAFLCDNFSFQIGDRCHDVVICISRLIFRISLQA